MRVVRSGDVDYIDIGVGEHFIIAVKHLADIVFFGKSHSLAVRSVTYGKQISSVFSIVAAVSLAITPVPSTARL